MTKGFYEIRPDIETTTVPDRGSISGWKTISKDNGHNVLYFHSEKSLGRNVGHFDFKGDAQKFIDSKTEIGKSAKFNRDEFKLVQTSDNKHEAHDIQRSLEMSGHRVILTHKRIRDGKYIWYIYARPMSLSKSKRKKPITFKRSSVPRAPKTTGHVGLGKGWHKQSLRHSKASIKGWRNRR